MTTQTQTESQTQTIEQVRQTMRARRALEEGIQDATENLAAHQAKFGVLANALANPENDNIEQTLAEARQQLRVLATELKAAKHALHEFAEQNPTAAELEAREKALVAAADVKRQQEAQAVFADNLRKRIVLFDELEMLEKESRDLYDQWPRTANGQKPGTAGIGNLLEFIPAETKFWPFVGYSYGAPAGALCSGNYADKKRRAEAWLKEFASK
jgi:hypothetical protein